MITGQLAWLLLWVSVMDDKKVPDYYQALNEAQIMGHLAPFRVDWSRVKVARASRRGNVIRIKLHPNLDSDFRLTYQLSFARL